MNLQHIKYLGFTNHKGQNGFLIPYERAILAYTIIDAHDSHEQWIACLPTALMDAGFEIIIA